MVVFQILSVAAGLVIAAPTSSLAPSSTLAPTPEPSGYILPQNDVNASIREQEIGVKQQGIIYGPSLLGETSFFPSGQVGDQISTRDQGLWIKDAAYVQQASAKEAAQALKAIKDHGGLKTLEDFAVLYDGQWTGTVPYGIADGILSNITSDLLFSMERLSINPYLVQRLHPTKDELPFDVDADVVAELTNSTLASLHADGRLFVGDHSYQKDYKDYIIGGRYTAACTALFYLDSRSDQFLPLAIKTNVGSDLTYTPLDEPNDWLLAKIMFNVNDLFHSQMYHLANSHAVAEIVNLAALRTLSSRHPVLGLLDRLMYQAYALRPVGEKILFSPGGYFDQNFALSNVAARTFAADSYPNITGPFESNYFESNLRARGLIDADYGPELPNLPFYEDGSKLIKVIRKFVKTFVETMYQSDEDVSNDWELQAWVAEANGPAKVIDFPGAFNTRQDLTDVLSHMAWLTGVSHHVLNQGEPVTTSGTLPLHPAALYFPIPTKKGGIDSVLPWLPNDEKSVDQISILARFNRPQVAEKKESTVYMFNYETLLAGTGEAVADANVDFINEMGAISREISGRTFDKDGLSQGMPFIWAGMDPNRIPFFLSV